MTSKYTCWSRQLLTFLAYRKVDSQSLSVRHVGKNWLVVETKRNDMACDIGSWYYKRGPTSMRLVFLRQWQNDYWTIRATTSTTSHTETKPNKLRIVIYPGSAGKNDNPNVSAISRDLKAADNFLHKIKLPPEVSFPKLFYTARSVNQKTKIDFGWYKLDKTKEN